MRGIGKVERWHQTLQTDFLNEVGPFATIEAAQAAVDAWRHEYNHDRPHQSLGMATPASRFRPAPPQEGEALSLWVPADLEPLTSPPPGPSDTPAVVPEAVSWPDAVEVDRVVPPSGNMTVGPQQFWLSPARAGQRVTLWIDATTCHLSIGGWRIKTVPSRLSEVELARLRRTDGRPAARHRLGHSRATPPTPEGGEPMPDMKLDASDAAELAEMLQFLTGWLARDPARLAASLEEFVGHPAYDIGQLRQDLERFVFLLGGSDGEPLFGLPPS